MATRQGDIASLFATAPCAVAMTRARQGTVAMDDTRMTTRKTKTTKTTA